MEKCCVADQFCTAAANVEGAYTKTKCFACGQAVCGKCSMKTNYHHYGKVRLCHNCIEDYDGNDKRVMRRLMRMAGYPITKGA